MNETFAQKPLSCHIFYCAFTTNITDKMQIYTMPEHTHKPTAIVHTHFDFIDRLCQVTMTADKFISAIDHFQLTISTVLSCEIAWIKGAIKTFDFEWVLVL